MNIVLFIFLWQHKVIMNAVHYVINFYTQETTKHEFICSGLNSVTATYGAMGLGKAGLIFG